MSEPGGPDGLPPLQPPGAGDAAPPPAPDGEAPGTGDEGEGGRPAVPRDKKNVQYAGRSVYIRKKIKTEDKDGQMKTKTFWVLEGRTLGDHDREFMWEERRAKDGSTQYRNAATGRSTRTLPDMGPTKSAIADPTEQLSPRRVKQQPMDGWNQDKKTAVQGHVRKLLSRQVKEGKIDPLPAEVQKILVKNVSDKHMSEHPPFDGELLPEWDGWLCWPARSAD
eukprot:TRINITY_DN5979_c0_g1_i2.p1 TRINITY_DN5979_c0_g1~~TRINITY_DN5979_c0_g1_i2.p1  ORF type:complete len:248 (+),score=70.50 TRINITY_DN5979_c0_g1_i2:80-745(+)